MKAKVVLLLMLLPFICSEGLAQSRIFWIDNDHPGPPYPPEGPPSVRSAWLNGSHLQTISRTSDAVEMVFDHTTGYIYYTSVHLGSSGRGSLFRINAGTSAHSDYLIQHYGPTRGLAIDYDAQKIYWATPWHLDWNQASIMRANLDGSQLEEVAHAAGVALGVAVDPIGGHVYWTAGATILRANTATGVVEDVGPSLERPPYPRIFDGDISIDAVARKMYWSRKGNRSSSGIIAIFRADLDGNNPELLWEEPYSDAGDIVVDGVNKYVYWTEWTQMADPTGVYIRRARTDQPITWDTIENIVGPPDTPSDLTAGIDLFLDPGPPVLEGPGPKAEGISTTTELHWRRVECSPRYDVQVASDTAFSQIVFRENTPHQTAEFVAPVAQHRYWWRIHSNACGIASHWSSPRWFEVGSSGPLAATLISPEKDAITAPSFTFSWTPGPEAVFQTLQLATTSDFSSTLVDAESLMVADYEVENLVPGQTYYWRVAGFDTEGRYTFTAPQVFSVATRPDAVTLVQPEDGQTETPAYTAFAWDPADGVASYHFELASSSDFTSIIVDEIIEGTSYEMTTPLPYAEAFFWRVCGVNAAGEGPWTSRSFTVAVGTATEAPVEIPEVTRLGNAYPNPSSGVLHIPFDLARPGNARIDVYDVFGRHMTTALDESLGAGRYAREVNVAGLASGTYVAVLKAGAVKAETVFTVVR